MQDDDRKTHDDATKDDYRDDPSKFAAGSDYAQRGKTDEYSGGSPADSSSFTSASAGQGNNAGSQEQWRDPQAAHAPSDDGSSAAPSDEAKDDGAGYGKVPSRSADPGQSSYGGFRDEGPSSLDAEQQKASDAASSTDDADRGQPRP